MKTLILLLLMTAPVLADCTVDYQCSSSCIMYGGFSPYKARECREMCTVCR